MYPEDVTTHHALPGGTFMRRIQRNIYDTPVRMCVASPPKIIAVFYHGGPFGGGKTTTADRANTTGKIYTATHKSALKQERKFVGRIIAPGATSTSGVANGIGFISKHYQKGDQIIIYAYSYGVDVAVDLCHQLNGKKTPVSLLVTVDGSDGPAQNWTVNTNIPNNVAININYYQTNNSGTSSFSRSSGASSSNSSSQSSSSDSGSSNSPGSNGGPNRAVKSANVINRNVTASGTTHGNIQQKHQAEIEKEIDDYIKKYKYEY